MKSIILASALATAMALSACAYPTSSIEQGTPSGHLRFIGGEAGGQLSLDGRVIGVRTAAKADVFDIPPGRHTVEAIKNGAVVLHKDYLVGAGSTIEIRAEQ